MFNWEGFIGSYSRKKVETSIFDFYKIRILAKYGEEGIRTLDTNEGIPVFETGRFNHSRTSPSVNIIKEI